MKYVIIFLCAIVVSGCATSPAPNLFNGNYYMVGDSSCVQGRSLTSTRIMCIDENGKETGYRDAMTRDQMQMYQAQSAERQRQISQLNQTMQRVGASAQYSTQQMLQLNQSLGASQYQPSFGQSYSGGARSSYSPNTGYQGSSGTRYQYDMNNLTDRNRYSTDLDAQRRDQMNLNIRRNLDRGLGQTGGGIYGSD